MKKKKYRTTPQHKTNQMMELMAKYPSLDKAEAWLVALVLEYELNGAESAMDWFMGLMDCADNSKQYFEYLKNVKEE